MGLIIAIVVLAIGWLPQPAAVFAWVAVGYCAVVTLFADSLELPAGSGAPPRSLTSRKCHWWTWRSRHSS